MKEFFWLLLCDSFPHTYLQVGMDIFSEAKFFYSPVWNEGTFKYMYFMDFI